ncbi:uncharacterized protein METZ01_LOCUS298166, partial [marine metagenome]
VVSELIYKSPIGPLTIFIYNRKVVRIKWGSPEKNAGKHQSNVYVDKITKSLNDYFSGKTSSL